MDPDWGCAHPLAPASSFSRCAWIRGVFWARRMDADVDFGRTHGCAWTFGRPHAPAQKISDLRMDPPLAQQKSIPVPRHLV